VNSKLDANSQVSATFAVVYQESTGVITISSTHTFGFLTEAEASDNNVTGYVPNQNAYEVVGWSPQESMLLTSALNLGGMVNLHAHNTLFLCSSDFGGLAGSLGPRGETNIIRRVVIDRPFGSTVHDLHGLNVDYVNCSGHQLNTLSFSLRDAYGNLVDLRGHNFSFSICLVDKNVL